MGKREEKIEIVRTGIRGCLASNSSADCFTYGNIPRKRYLGACKKYVSNEAYEDVIGLIDTTVFGGGERGLVFTLTGVYYRDIMGNISRASYSNISGFPNISDTYFDGAGVKRLLQRLSAVDNSSSSNSSGGGGFLNGLLDIAGSVIKGLGDAYVQEQERQSRQEEEELVEMLKGFKECLKSIKSDFSNLEDYDELETWEEVQNALINAFVVASVYSCDNEWLEELTGEESDDEDEIDVIAQINEYLNYSLDDTDTDQNFLIRGMEKYHHKMHVIFEEIGEADSEEDIDIEDMYNRTKRAVSEFRNVLTKANNMINELLDEYYEEY